MLTNSPLVEILMYVNDVERSRSFYESGLGLQAAQSDDSSVKYDAGRVMLALADAGEHGVKVGERDDTAQIVFYVDDLDAARAELESRGVVFGETLRYEIGATAAFYDPDGHFLTLYEPSPEAMTWPSAAKLRELVDAGAKPGAAGLDGCPIIYLFLYIADTEAAAAFFHGSLGLREIEGDADAGVVKYDAQTLLLTTHLVGGDAACAVDLDLTRPKGIASVFRVDQVGEPARLMSPDGHEFRLLETALR